MNTGGESKRESAGFQLNTCSDDSIFFCPSSDGVSVEGVRTKFEFFNDQKTIGSVLDFLSVKLGSLKYGRVQSAPSERVIGHRLRPAEEMMADDQDFFHLSGFSMDDECSLLGYEAEYLHNIHWYFFHARENLKDLFFKSDGYERTVIKHIYINEMRTQQPVEKFQRISGFTDNDCDTGLRCEYAIQLLTWTFSCVFSLTVFLSRQEGLESDVELGKLMAAASAVIKMIDSFCALDTLPKVGGKSWCDFNIECMNYFEPFFKLSFSSYRKGDGWRWMKKNNPLISPQITLNPDYDYRQTMTLVEKDGNQWTLACPVEVPLDGGLLDEHLPEAAIEIVKQCFLGPTALNSQADSALPRNSVIHCELIKLRTAEFAEEEYKIVGKPQCSMASFSGDTSKIRAMSDMLKSNKISTNNLEKVMTYVETAIDLFQSKLKEIGYTCPRNFIWHHLIANLFPPEYDIHRYIRALIKQGGELKVFALKLSGGASLDWVNFPNSDYRSFKTQMPLVLTAKFSDFVCMNPFLSKLANPLVEDDDAVSHHSDASVNSSPSLTDSGQRLGRADCIVPNQEKPSLAQLFYCLAAYVESKQINRGSRRVHITEGEAQACLQTLCDMIESTNKKEKVMALFLYLFLENRYEAYRNTLHHANWDCLKFKTRSAITACLYLEFWRALYCTKKERGAEKSNGVLPSLLSALYFFLLHDVCGDTAMPIVGCKSNKDRAGWFRMLYHYVRIANDAWEKGVRGDTLSGYLIENLKPYIVSNAASLLTVCQTTGTMKMAFTPNQRLEKLLEIVRSTAVLRRSCFAAKKTPVLKKYAPFGLSAVSGAVVGGIVAGMIALSLSCPAVVPVIVGAAIGCAIACIIFAIVKKVTHKKEREKTLVSSQAELEGELSGGSRRHSVGFRSSFFSSWSEGSKIQSDCSRSGEKLDDIGSGSRNAILFMD